MIVYLTGTGNTLLVAKKIAEDIGEQKLLDAQALSGKICLDEGVSLGVFFPVHGWRPPKLLRNILQNLEVEGYSAKSNYVYAVCTVGDTVGETMRYLTDDLQRVGVTLDAAFDVQMPNTYIGLPFMDVDSQRLTNEKLKNAEQRISELANKIKSRHKGADLKHKGRWPRINSRLLGWLFADALVTDTHFHVDTTQCIGCGICQKSCPTHDITLSKDGCPEWQHNKKCMTCFACYHNCPKHAIQYGRFTRGKGQYRLPH